MADYESQPGRPAPPEPSRHSRRSGCPPGRPAYGCDYRAISRGWTGFPSSANDNRSDTSVLGCRATEIWNSSVVGAVISTSGSAPTSRFIALREGRGSATKTARRTALAIGGRRLTFSGCSALVLPRRLCRSNFPSSRPAPGTRTKYVLNSQRDAGTRWCRPAHVGMVADNTCFGDVRHVCLSISRPERAAG
jgi:hypothetical protein